MLYSHELREHSILRSCALFQVNDVHDLTCTLSPYTMVLPCSLSCSTLFSPSSRSQSLLPPRHHNNISFGGWSYTSASCSIPLSSVAGSPLLVVVRLWFLQGGIKKGERVEGWCGMHTQEVKVHSDITLIYNGKVILVLCMMHQELERSVSCFIPKRCQTTAV